MHTMTQPTAFVTAVQRVGRTWALTATAPCGATVSHGGGPAASPPRLGSRVAHCEYQKPNPRRPRTSRPSCDCGSYVLVLAPGVEVPRG